MRKRKAKKLRKQEEEKDKTIEALLKLKTFDEYVREGQAWLEYHYKEMKNARSI